MEASLETRTLPPLSLPTDDRGESRLSAVPREPWPTLPNIPIRSTEQMEYDPSPATTSSSGIPSRSQSPSDQFLIRRPMVYQHHHVPVDAHKRFIQGPVEPMNIGSFPPGGAHRRTYSTPNLSARGPDEYQQPAWSYFHESMPPAVPAASLWPPCDPWTLNPPGPTLPPISQSIHDDGGGGGGGGGDDDDCLNNGEPISPRALSETAGFDSPMHCMFVQSCHTNSQLRKAISHLFGRNKLCTRLIPDHVWVYFCRKHYQRSRYRSGAHFSRIQCDLVDVQLRRIERWSQENRVRGTGASVVKEWTLEIRKRERDRMDRGRAQRRADGPERFDGGSVSGSSVGGSVGVDGDGDTNESERGSATAVPDWLWNLKGGGYSAVAIQRIIGKIRDAIVSGALQQFPDIELLPTISGGRAPPRRERAWTRGHTRAARSIL